MDIIWENLASQICRDEIQNKLLKKSESSAIFLKHKISVQASLFGPPVYINNPTVETQVSCELSLKSEDLPKNAKSAAKLSASFLMQVPVAKSLPASQLDTSFSSDEASMESSRTFSPPTLSFQTLPPQ